MTRQEAERLNMTIWTGNDGERYARLPHGKDRQNSLYGYVFLIIQ